MKLSYSSLKDEDLFIVTDFSCAPSLDLLDRNDLFKIIWCTQDTIDLWIDSYKVTLKTNEVIFCTPLNVLEVNRINSNAISLVFNKEFFCIQTHDDQVSCQGFLFFGSSEPQRIQLGKGSKVEFETIFSMLKEDFEVDDPLQGELLRSLLKRLLIKSTRLVKKGIPQPAISQGHLNVIREYNMLVEQHFREYHHVQDYAKLLYKSPKTLSNLFPKYTDKSPLMVINDRLLLEAKRLLVYSKKTANDIAYELGYKDPGHFSKFFKKHVGMTPSNYRKERA